MNQNIRDIFLSGNLVIPIYLFKFKEKFNIKTDSFLLLCYFIDKKITDFDPNELSQIFNFSLDKIMECMNDLTLKKVLSVDVCKSEKGILEEKINLDLFYSKLNNVLIEEVNNQKIDEKDIYKIFEEEFGRVLSSMEYEIINAWISSKINQELILEALKEGVMNGVNNLRYIDKILYDWGKKGYKNKEDVEKSRQQFRKKQEIKRMKKDVFDYNWLEDLDE